jgi:hypothetical protein
MSDDPTPEGSEELELRLSDPAGAFLRADRASGTILDDDRVAVLSVAAASGAEGDPGRPGTARFTLRLDVPTGTPVEVTYQVADGTALAGHDYVAVGGTLTLAPGATEQTIDVPILADLEPEGDEYFSLSVSSASATVATPSVTGTIGDDDGPTGFYTISPCRLLDTRLHGWPVPGGAFRAFPAGNVCGIPVDAEAVVVNVTVVGPTHLGHVNVSPFGAAPTPTSAVNFGPGAVKGAGPLVVTLGEDGRLAVHCVMPPGSAGATHVVVDVAGYFE